MVQVGQAAEAVRLQAVELASKIDAKQVEWALDFRSQVAWGNSCTQAAAAYSLHQPNLGSRVIMDGSSSTEACDNRLTRTKSNIFATCTSTANINRKAPVHLQSALHFLTSSRLLKSILYLLLDRVMQVEERLPVQAPCMI